MFLIALDALYRRVVKKHEETDLLECARVVGRTLRVRTDASAPLEGYYGESPLLTEYLQWVRALQVVPAQRKPEVERLHEYQKLLAFTSSRHLGHPNHEDKLLPRARDPLSVALLKLRPTWTVEALVTAAKQVTLDIDDISLVGLAALAEDEVAMTALRETVVLYAEVILTGIPAPVRNEFAWRVAPELAARGARFVTTVNALLQETLPVPAAAAAEDYWYAYAENRIAGRCVRIGSDERQDPPRHYHWAVKTEADRLVVDEFWDTSIWTTEVYRRLREP